MLFMIMIKPYYVTSNILHVMQVHIVLQEEESSIGLVVATFPARFRSCFIISHFYSNHHLLLNLPVAGASIWGYYGE